MKQQSKYENIVYVALWGLLFIAPLLNLHIRTASDADQSFEWQEILMVWKTLAIYLGLFLLHNFVLAPLLIWKHKRTLYFTLTGCILAVFMAYQCTTKPVGINHMPRPMDMEHRDGPPPMDGERTSHAFGDDRQPHHEEEERPAPPDHLSGQKHGMKPDNRMMPKKHPPLFIGQHDVIAIVILFLMFSANLGLKDYFKSRKDHKKLVELEKKSLEQQLEYLKYQINPHFFMNTLNNIHALVDIDPEKAKDTILELSKMMRFVLYEGNKHGVPLTREFDFIGNYITLMKLRYTDKVKITVDLPTATPDKMIPPLMLITFIENAFKHGISYEHESFVNVKIGIEDTKLRFSCCNSKANKPNREKGGVGLNNVKQRLHLLYDNNYTLKIQDNPDFYNVELTIPLT